MVLANSTKGPNNTSLFVVDITGTNGCNAIVAAGGSCVFKLSAATTDMSQVGTFFGQVQVQVVDSTFLAPPYPQVATADVKINVVKPAILAFTPSTDFGTDMRDLGTVVLNTTSAPVKYTLVNIGGQDSKLITVKMPLHGGNDSQTKARFVADASACSSLGESGLSPGSKCDILVTFHPTSSGTPSDAGLSFDADLVVTAAGPDITEVRNWVHGTASSAFNNPYLADDTTGAAPADLGVVKSSVLTVTRTLAVHAGSGFSLPVSLPTTAAVAVFGTGAVLGTGEGMALTYSGTGACTTPLDLATASGNKCTFTATWTLGTGATPGWRVFTVTMGTLTMNVFGRVGAAPQLSVSRTQLDFGKVSANGSTESQHETVMVTNTGELPTTAGVTAELSSSLLGIGTNGCSSGTLSYQDSCPMDIWVVPQTPGQDAADWVRAASTGALPSAHVVLNWWGTTAPSLTFISAVAGEGTAHTFADLPVLKADATDFAEFVVTNGANAQASGLLTFALTDGSGNVAGDYFMVPGSNSTCLAMGLLDTNQSCTVRMQFKPTSLDPVSKVETLTLTATPGTTTTPPKVTLTGKALPALSVIAAARGVVGGAVNPPNPTVSLTGAIVTAPDGTTKSLAVPDTSVIPGPGTDVRVTFTNTSTQTTGILTAAVAGANVGDFVVREDTCTGQQKIGSDTCYVTVTFRPASVGGKTAAITVSGSPGDSASLTLTGNGSP